jgi:hypothetical protein
VPGGWNYAGGRKWTISTPLRNATIRQPDPDSRNNRIGDVGGLTDGVNSNQTGVADPKLAG